MNTLLAYFYKSINSSLGQQFSSFPSDIIYVILFTMVGPHVESSMNLSLTQKERTDECDSTNLPTTP